MFGAPSGTEERRRSLGSWLQPADPGTSGQEEYRTPGTQNANVKTQTEVKVQPQPVVGALSFGCLFATRGNEEA